MIKLPEEIAHIIGSIEGAGYEAYAVGGCVRDSILGRDPGDWDLTSNASRDILEALFPDAQIVNKKLGVIRVSRGDITADVAAYRIDGEYKDYRRPETVIFTEDINEDLRRRDFTMNAIAVSPVRGVVDPYGGIEDIGRKLIRGIGEPRMRFEEDALRILRAVRFAAQLDFEIEEDTFRAMKEKAALLEHISTERIREEFTKTITARSGGKGLELYIKAGLLPYILGEDCANRISDEEMERLAVLAEAIHLTKPDPALRIALFYQCFEEERALCAIDNLGYSNEMKKLLRFAVSLFAEMEKIGDKVDLKRFLVKVGLAHYRYLTELAEQRSKVLRAREAESRSAAAEAGLRFREEGDLRPDQAGNMQHGKKGTLHSCSEGTLQSCEEGLRRRAALFKEIQDNGEPVFQKDLALNGSDLIGLGISEGEEIGRLLGFLLDTVHRFPEKNDKRLLLGMAAARLESDQTNMN